VQDGYSSPAENNNKVNLSIKTIQIHPISQTLTHNCTTSYLFILITVD